MKEFELIERFFKCAHTREDVVEGIGDDGAVLRVCPDRDLVWSVDTLVGDVHFTAATEPVAVGHKCLAVNLSDLAAMGAEPAWASLALTLPTVDEDWLREFSRGFLALADQHQLALVGGDTTEGPLSITVNVAGFVPRGQALRRCGAKPGHRIYVSGEIGDAAMAWVSQLNSGGGDDVERGVLRRLQRPIPRISLGLALRQLASAAIDISDGLLADLNHMLVAAGVGASIYFDRLPFSVAGRAYLGKGKPWALLVSAGDDYELCFTVPAEHEQELYARLASRSPAVTCIGEIDVQHGLRLIDAQGNRMDPPRLGYEHFSE